jgi:hypothetical protein
MSPRTRTHLFEKLIFQTGREQNTVLGILRWIRRMDTECRGQPLPPRAQRSESSRRPERHRQQLFQISRDRFPTIANTNNRRVSAKFRQHLPTRAARSNRLRSRSVEHQRPYLRMPCRNRLKDRVPLRTYRKPIRRVLNIASANNFPVPSKHRGPHPKLTVRTIRKRTRLARRKRQRRQLISRNSVRISRRRKSPAFRKARLAARTRDSSHRHSSS